MEKDERISPKIKIMLANKMEKIINHEINFLEKYIQKDPENGIGPKAEDLLIQSLEYIKLK